MAISKYTRPIEGIGVPTAPAMDLNLVANTLGRLSDSQRRGQEAYTKMELMKAKMLESVLPGQRQYANDIVDEAGAGIQKIAESGNFINAEHRIGMDAAKMVSKMSRFNSNYAQYQKHAEDQRKRLADGDISEAEYYWSVEDPLKQMQANGAEGIYTPGTANKHVDINKEIDDRLDGWMANTYGHVSRTADGRYIVTESKKEITKAELVEAGNQIIASDPRMMRQVAREARYQRLRRGMDGEDILAEAEQKIEALNEQWDAIEANADIPAEQKEAFLQRINELQTSLSEDPEAALVRLDAQEMMNDTIDFVANKYSYSDYDVDEKGDPYAMIDARAAASADGGGTSSFSPHGGLQNTGLMNRDVDYNMDIRNTEEELSSLQERLGSEVSQVEKGKLQSSIDEKMMALAQKNDLVDEALSKAGLSKEEYDRIQGYKIARPASMTNADEKKYNAWFLKYGLNKGNLSQLAGLPDEHKKWVRDVLDHRKKISRYEQDQIDAVDDYLDEHNPAVSSEYVSVRTGTEDNIVDTVNILKNAGGVYKDKRGRVIKDDVPAFVEVMIPKSPVGGKFTVIGNDKDGESFSYEPDDTAAYRKYIASIVEGGSELYRPFNDVLMNLDEGRSTPLIRGGKNILDMFGEGTRIQRHTGGTAFFLVDSGGNKMKKPNGDYFEFINENAVKSFLEDLPNS